MSADLHHRAGLRRSFQVAGLLFCSGMILLTGLIPHSQAQLPEADKPLQFAMNPFHANIGDVTSVEADGTITLARVANPAFVIKRGLADRNDLTEGWYLGLVGEEFIVSTEDLRLVRLQVREVGKKNTATLQLTPEAAGKIRVGEQILLFRPPGSTTAELKAAPDFVEVDDGVEVAPLGRNAVNVASRLAQSRNNLKQIGLALHNFHDTHGRFPPAVVYGPDGKPWHSWRVLLLPFVDQAPLYDQYRFSEPWNSEHNSSLLEKMPSVYRDPIYGNPEDFFTHYAAVTGKGTAFPTEGSKQAKATDSPFKDLEKARGALQIRNFTDGTSNSVLVGPVSPERKIPWMKPEDVVVGKKFPAFGEKGSFALPYETGDRKGGPFLFADGGVQTITSDIDADTISTILHIGDGEVLDWASMPILDKPNRRRSTKAAQAIEIIRRGDGYMARLMAD